MKTFTYRWQSDGQEYRGVMDHEDEEKLRDHVERSGGELIEIIETREKPEELTRPPFAPGIGEEAHTDIVVERSTADDRGKKTPSIGIRIFGWLYIAAAVIICAIVVYAYLIKGVAPTMKVAGTIITGGQARLFSGMIMVAAGMILAVTGIGLLRVKKWARVIVLVFAWLDIANSILSVFFGRIHVPLGSLFTIWFFSRGGIKRQFSRR